MRAPRCRWRLLVALCGLLAGTAAARDECPFLRDPAFHARTAVAPAAGDELAVGTLNLFRLFDDERDGHEDVRLSRREFAARIGRIAGYIVHDMGAPAAVGLQEIEDDTAAAALAAGVSRRSGREYRYLLGDKAPDSDIRNALLYDARLTLQRTESLFAARPYEKGPRFDRLPLLAEFDTGHGRLALVVVHLKSQVGIDRPDESARVLAKRRAQAGRLAAWVGDRGAGEPPLLVLGDFNASATDDDAARSEPLRMLLAGGALVDVAGRFLRPTQRWTYRYRCSLQQLDHVLVSPALAGRVRGYAIARGDTCLRAPEKCSSTRSISDHEGVVLRLGR
ncbi:MAG: endonuclease/exonuclease/phosphatase family protein [Pseudomonadota bacterium]